MIPSPKFLNESLKKKTKDAFVKEAKELDAFENSQNTKKGDKKPKYSYDKWLCVRTRKGVVKGIDRNGVLNTHFSPSPSG